MNTFCFILCLFFNVLSALAAPVAGSQFGYGYGNIGKRLTGTERGALIRREAYAPNSARKQLTFAYDHQGGRVSKVVATWNGSSYTSPSTNKFVYDGWNLMAELNGTNGLVRSYAWGLDLSGTHDGAGGIGGLVSITEHGPPAVNHFAGYDGNGNLTTLVKNDLTESARYEYDPYGEPIRVTGTTSNPFRWSTKYTDAETDLVYYGYRYYSPANGDWISRDPIDESGDLNLYEYGRNQPTGKIDAYGHFGFGIIDMLISSENEQVNKAVQLKQGYTLVSRIRNVVKGLNNLQRFSEGVDTANGFEIGDLLQDLQKARSIMSDNFRGEKTGRIAAALSDHDHHIFPDAKEFAKFFKRNKINVNAVLVSINGYLHKYGLHNSGTGSAYNRVWRDFIRKSGSRIKDDPYYVMGFGFGLMTQIEKHLMF